MVPSYSKCKTHKKPHTMYVTYTQADDNSTANDLAWGRFDATEAELAVIHVPAAENVLSR